MKGELLATATPVDLKALWPAVEAAHLFASWQDFHRFHADDPWRVRVASGGRAAILERWRDHLDVLAVRGVWASARDLVDTIVELRELAFQEGYARLLSPLVTQEAKGPYVRAGLEPLEVLVAYRLNARAAPALTAAVPEGVHLRGATTADLSAIDALDRECFDPFWAYGEATLAAFLASNIVAVAESVDGLIGYTLSTVDRGSGTLGRIAVAPHYRDRGIGRALLAGAMRDLARSGAGSISLCTRETNTTARRMYRAAGMREVPGKLVFLAGETRGDRERP